MLVSCPWGLGDACPLPLGPWGCLSPTPGSLGMPVTSPKIAFCPVPSLFCIRWTMAPANNYNYGWGEAEGGFWRWKIHHRASSVLTINSSIKASVINSYIHTITIITSISQTPQWVSHRGVKLHTAEPGGIRMSKNSRPTPFNKVWLQRFFASL